MKQTLLTICLIGFVLPSWGQATFSGGSISGGKITSNEVGSDKSFITQKKKDIDPQNGIILKHIKGILDKEKTKFEIEALVNIVNKHHPDIRKMLNTIQLSTQNNELVVDESILVSSNYIKQVIAELKNPKTDYRKLRQIIADSGVKDFEELYRSLFDNTHEYAKGREGSVAIILNEHQYHSNFRIDKEKVFFFYGSGANGKSKFVEQLQGIMGAYSRKSPVSTFIDKRYADHPTELAGLKGARLVTSSEIPPGTRWNEAIIKDLTGGDTISARLMRQDFFDFKPQLTLIIVGGIFVMEAGSVILQVASFKSRGKRIFLMSPIHHHFELKGWKETKVVIRFWILSLLFALVGLATLKLR